MTTTPDNPIRDAHDNLKAGIEQLKKGWLGHLPPEIYKAMHALSYAVKAAGEKREDEDIDFTLNLLCDYLGVDPKSVTWDAATETRDGDVSAVIGNILRAKFGEDWGPEMPPAPMSNDPLREALAVIVRAADNYADCDDGRFVDNDAMITVGDLREIRAALAQPAPMPQTLGGMIAAIYGDLDAEDCTRVDRAWMEYRKMAPAPVSDERALELAHQICVGKFSAVQGAVEIMHYATDAIEQERKHWAESTAPAPRIHDATTGDTFPASELTPLAGTREVERYMDEIDAATAGSAWLEPIAKALPKHPSNEITCEKVGNDGNVRLLWHKDIIQAGFFLLRDDANFTQLLRFGIADAILSAGTVRDARAEVIEECAKVAEKKSKITGNEHDFHRGYAVGRSEAAAAIRALALPRADGGK